MSRDYSNVVAIGASAGGIAAGKDLVRRLPSDFAAPVVFALHARRTNALPDVMRTVSLLDVVLLEDTHALSPGKLYLCPGGKQTLFQNQNLVVVDDHLGERFAPSIDLLFRTLGAEHGHNGIAVILSGMLDDGSLGAQELSRHGGQVLVQDPEQAEFPSMPASAILTGQAVSILTTEEIAERLIKLVNA